MKLKVCGLNNVSNIIDVVQLQPEFAGFIFHQPSSRNCIIPADVVKELKVGATKKVGVFVNESVKKVVQIVRQFGLDYAQLHGGELVDYCKSLKDCGIKIIKVFSVNDVFNMDETSEYQFCDYLLFDTKGKLPGGNGTRFNWGILADYKGTVPYIISGGIELSHSVALRKIAKENPLLSVVDINSKFEIEPGLKNIEEVEEFINEINISKHV